MAELKAYSKLTPNKDILISSLSLKKAKASSEIENIITTNGIIQIQELLSNLENYYNIEDDVDPLIKLTVSYY